MTAPTEVLDAIRALLTATPDDGQGVSATWEATGRDKAAPDALVQKVLPGHVGPVCLGTLEQIATMGPDQSASNEGVWGADGVLTGVNRDFFPGSPAIERPT